MLQIMRKLPSSRQQVSLVLSYHPDWSGSMHEPRYTPREVPRDHNLGQTWGQRAEYQARAVDSDAV